MDEKRESAGEEARTPDPADLTLGGYLVEHSRPPAFEGVDGEPYTVSAEAEQDPEPPRSLRGIPRLPAVGRDGARRRGPRRDRHSRARAQPGGRARGAPEAAPPARQGAPGSRDRRGQRRRGGGRALMHSLPVTEIFHSIQGESTWAGSPCTFVRLTGCPLRCVWCDTAYAFRGGEKMSSRRDRLPGSRDRLSARRDHRGRAARPQERLPARGPPPRGGLHRARRDLGVRGHLRTRPAGPP